MLCRSFILAVLGWAVVAAAAIPMGDELFPASQSRELHYECLRRLMSQAYASAHPEATELDQRAMEYLDAIARRDAGYTDHKPIEDLERIGRELHIDGSDDPLIIAVHALLLYEQQKYTQAMPILERSADALAGSSYSPYLRARVMEILVRHANLVTQRDTANERLRALVPVLQDIVSRRVFRTEEQPILYELLSSTFHNGNSVPYTEIFSEWLSESAEADPWLVQMMAGTYHLRASRILRTRIYFEHSGEEDMEAFRAHLQQSKEHFELAWHANPAWPEPALRIIELISDSFDQEGAAASMRMWFDRAATSRFDNPYLYYVFIVCFNSGWEDRSEQVYAFGIECAETKRYDTDVPLQLISALKNLRWRDGQRAWRKQGVYDQVRQMLEGYLSEPSQQYRRGYFLTMLAAFAHVNGRWDDAAAALDGLHDVMDSKAVWDIQLATDTFIGEIRLRTNPATAELVKTAERLNVQNKWEEAIAAYRQIIPLPLSPAERQYLNECIWLREVENGARNGEWTDLTFDDALSGWRNQSGYWTRENDRTIIGIAADRGLVLNCQAHFGKRFEIRGRFEFIGQPNDLYGAGYFMWNPTHERVFQMSVAPTRGISRMYNFSDERKEDPATTLDTVANSLHLVVDRNMLSGFANDQELYQPHTPGPFPTDGFNRLGIGGMYHYPGTAVRISDLQVRRIK